MPGSGDDGKDCVGRIDMKFEIFRTSTWDTKKPCPEATEEDYIRIEERTVDDPKKIPAHNGTDGDWYRKGKNHRVENGCIRRDFGGNKRWVVELKSIQALIEFAQKYGDIIIGSLSYNGKDIPSIEIYDDYQG